MAHTAPRSSLDHAPQASTTRPRTATRVLRRSQACARRCSRGRQSRHVLFGAEQRGPRDSGGNPGAVGVRAKYAQHCFTSHVEFRIGSGLAGVHEGGNVAEDVRFIGGEYGIWTGTPSPGWQYTLVDASFEGQRRAAIREHEAGLTLIRPHFRKVPTAIEIEEGSPDELWVKDARLEDVSGPAFVISFEGNPRTEINMEGIVCRRVPVFAAFRESGRRLAAPGELYAVSAFTHGLGYSDIDAPGKTMDVFDARTLKAWPEPVASDLVPLPDASTWVNVRTLGAKGDGASDDTEAFRNAIASNRAIYVPTGKYIVTDTLMLKPDTVLIGLHPSATQLVVPDRTPAFQGIGPPRAAPGHAKGRHERRHRHWLVYERHQPASGGRAVARRRALDDERRALPGRARHQRARRQARESLQQHAQRRPGSRAAMGLAVSESLGHRRRRRHVLRSVDAEHVRAGGHAGQRHVHERTRLPGVERASCALRGADQARGELGIYALQTEGERGESGFSSALEIDASRNITVANMHMYRVISSNQPFPVRDSRRRLPRHPVQEHSFLQQQQGRVRRDRVRQRARRSSFASANSRGSRSGPPRSPDALRPWRHAASSASCRSWPMDSTTSREAPSRRPAISISSMRNGTGSIAGPFSDRVLTTDRGRTSGAGEPCVRQSGQPARRVVRGEGHRLLNRRDRRRRDAAPVGGAFASASGHDSDSPERRLADSA